MIPPQLPRPFVTVVIPTRNRASVLGRAITSVLEQTHHHLELLIVDDASTDGTPEFVRGLSDGRIRYLRHEEPRNAAVARNTGLAEARGSHVAFLDSDDEWRTNHLERKLTAMAKSSAHGAFGAFHVERGGKLRESRCRPIPPGMSLATYILSGIGDVRSSTLLFDRDALAAVRFDPHLRKHQDWDLGCRFADRFRLVLDPVSTVILHEGAGRMTAELDHDATHAFLERHAPYASEAATARFLTVWALRTFRAEGRSAAMRRYLAQARSVRGDWRFRLVGALLSLPVAGRVFSRLHRGYVALKRYGHSSGSLPRLSL